MTQYNNLWKTDQIDNLYDNWEYFLENKKDAEIVLSHNWNAIRRKAYDLGLKSKRPIFASNKNILCSLTNYINGLLLGDGCIHRRNETTGTYTQKCKHILWLTEIQKKFEEYNITSSIYRDLIGTSNFSDIKRNKVTTIYNQLDTKYYIELNELYNKWYKKQYDIDNYDEKLWYLDKDSGEWYVWKKIVPKDIDLTPECVLNLYLGDGHFNYSRITFATNGFMKEDAEYLAFLLNEQIVDCACVDKHSQQENYIVYIGKQTGINIFFDYISSLEHPTCYNYKFPQIN